MVRPDRQESTLTLERHLEQLRDNLSPGEQRLLGELLSQVAELRAEMEGSDPVVRPSEMPAAEGREAGDMPSEQAAPLTGEMPTDVTLSPVDGGETAMPAGSGMPTAGNEMPTATPPVGGSDIYGSGPSEMPGSVQNDVFTAGTNELPASDAVGADEGEGDGAPMVVSEMPSVMPQLGGEQGMPAATTSPH